MLVAVALVSELLGNLIGYLPVYLPLYLYPLIVAIGMASYLGINFLQLRRINQIPWRRQWHSDSAGAGRHQPDADP